MILLVRDGSRWSINWQPSLIDILEPIISEYNDAMYKLQVNIYKAEKVKKDIERRVEYPYSENECYNLNELTNGRN